MSKAVVEITIRKDNDQSYARRERITISNDIYNIIDDGMQTCTADIYNGAWLIFFTEICSQVDNLPDDWYMCRSERKLIECY